MRLAVQIALSIVLGFVLMFPRGWRFGVMSWPTFHSWGLMHGSFFCAWPTLAVVAFALLSLIPWFTRIADARLIAPAALVGLGITSALVVTEPSGGMRVPIYLLAVAFGASAALCYFARRPWVIALVVALPMIFFDSQFLMMSLDAILGYMSYSVLSTTVPIIISAFLGMAAAYAASRVRSCLTARR
jgi:hypothetical protein